MALLIPIIRTLLYYIAKDGSVPAEDWLENLKDRKGADIIRNRLDRLANGNLGDSKSIGNGLKELRIHFGPGYRVYFGEYQQQFVILLTGGDKNSQSKDIRKAKVFWADYRRRE